MEILTRYSGITAIFVYGFILFLILKFKKKKPVDTVKTVVEQVKHERLDLEDEDATIASLIAAIECREQYHKNVQIVSVRRIS